MQSLTQWPISLTWCPWVQKLVPYNYIDFIWVSPYYSFKGIFTVFYRPYFLKTCVVQTHKNYESALPWAGHCFANEVQILCSSETSIMRIYHKLPTSKKIHAGIGEKGISWFWEILHTWVVLPSFVLVCLILCFVLLFSEFCVWKIFKIVLVYG